MKKHYAMLLLLLFTDPVFSQGNVKYRDDYMQLSKQNKTIGWILFGGGMGFIVTGVAIMPKSNDYGAGGALLFITGVVSTIVSVPLFNSAAKYKKKAVAIGFSNQSVELAGIEKNRTLSSLANNQGTLKNSRMIYKTIPAVYLKINL